MTKNKTQRRSNLWFRANGNLELFRSTRDVVYAREAICAYMQYRNEGGQNVIPALEKVREQKDQRYKQERMKL